MSPLPLLAAAGLSAATAPLPLASLSWQIVNDGVMGGRSQGETEHTPDGLRFAGTLSLENNGGFASVRSAPAPLGLEGSGGLRIELEGDGRTWLFTVRRADVPLRAGSYRVALPTEAGTTSVHEVTWADFQPTSFGRPVRGAPALDSDLSQLESIGLMVADKQPGPFSVTLRSVAATGSSAKTADSTASATDQTAGRAAVRDSFAAAIRLGVPAFNRGDAGRCRAHYQSAIETVLLLGAPGLSAAEQGRLREALGEATDQADAEAAWTLRRAMDRVLGA
jgi:monofunctional biosynthetic peptidoglycan transglycosylase